MTKEKVNQINLLDPLPYEAPEEIPANEIEVVDETEVSNEIADAEDGVSKASNKDTKQEPSKDNKLGSKGTLNDKGQTTLF